MKKKILCIVIVGVIVFFGYRYFHNLSAKDVNSKSIQFSYEETPNFNGRDAYISVNDNKPYFTSDEILTESSVKYGPQDSIKRVTSAMACIGNDSMPEDDAKDDEISVEPTGWNNVQYDCIKDNDGYCQTKVQLISWNLCGSGADKRNVIAASPYLRQNMNMFAQRVARYIDKTNNHVMYRVTPIFQGEEVLCRGVLVEAYSVEDSGAGLSFNVFLYNVQPGIGYIYSSGESTYTGEYEDAVFSGDITRDYAYILNEKTMTVHKPDCLQAAKIGTKNKAYSNADIEDLIGAGYKSADCCNP